jgi:reductive dehalogenase
MEIVFTLNAIIGSTLFLFFIYGIITSMRENEKTAVFRLSILSIILPLPFFISTFLPIPFKVEISIGLLSIFSLITIILFIPIRGNKIENDTPLNRIDERDTMFSRNELNEDSERFEKYYENNPDKKILDDKFRKRPGLLKPGSTQYNPFHFAAADSSFETIAKLHSMVDGERSENPIKVKADEITEFIKNWSVKLGAEDCGVTELHDYHLYRTGGRGERYGKPVLNNHKYAIAFTTEMDKTMIHSAPTGSIVMESGQQYLDSGTVAIQVAKFIRNLGYSARAHIDGNYQVVCPLVARDAGLGEIGRMGLLMTPQLGPRVRISVVTTDIPLLIDKRITDYSVIDFCMMCKKCAIACPSKAISFEDKKEIDRVRRWQINSESCFTLWSTFGTDCGRCVAICPYSHPDNLFHNFIRFSNRNSKIFRWFAVIMDDAIYGKKPPTAELPNWMQINTKEDKHISK